MEGSEPQRPWHTQLPHNTFTETHTSADVRVHTFASDVCVNMGVLLSLACSLAAKQSGQQGLRPCKVHKELCLHL